MSAQGAACPVRNGRPQRTLSLARNEVILRVAGRHVPRSVSTVDSTLQMWGMGLPFRSDQDASTQPKLCKDSFTNTCTRELLIILAMQPYMYQTHCVHFKTARLHRFALVAYCGSPLDPGASAGACNFRLRVMRRVASAVAAVSTQAAAAACNCPARSA